MARAKAPRKAPRADSPEQQLIEAALRLAASQGWRRTGLAEIAAEAKLTLPQAYALHRSKGGILRPLSAASTAPCSRAPRPAPTVPASDCSTR